MSAMEQLIPVINRLQEVFYSVGMLDTVDLPQIAVVGSQSAGKSSVLENIVGNDFLPRGSNIVTRRPLVLQLIQLNKKNLPDIPKENIDKDGNTAYGEFLHMPNKRFFNFNEIREEINNETDRVTGKNKGVSPLPIHLKIYSTTVLNLTLIDLPGVTKIPVGDQPKDIELQIRKMCLQFIKKPNCIILAVTAANTDISNSDGIKLAREVDPQGERTLGVLTKVDIMDKGTDAMEVIQGKIVQLKKGFVPIVNRSQEDINKGKSIMDALKAEKEFFANHEAYKGIAEKCGTSYLSKKLNNVLLHHIKETLPDLKTKISSLVVQAQKRMQEYGMPLNELGLSNSAILLNLLTEFSHEFQETIEGRNVSQMSNNELYGGARINYIFLKKFAPYLMKMDACEGLTDTDIRTQIRNAKGTKMSLFIPEESFENLVKRQVKQLEMPCLRCVDQVYEELKLIVAICEKRLFRFPVLRQKVKDFVISIMDSYCTPLREFITNLINIEMSYINTAHPDFFNGGNTTVLLLEKLKMSASKLPSPNGSLPNAPGMPNAQSQFNSMSGSPPNQFNPQQPGAVNPNASYVDGSPQDKERMEISLIKTLLTEYFSIVRKSISDSVPKSIMFFLVNKSKDNLHAEFVKTLYKEELFEELLKEDDEVAQKRQATKKMLTVLLRAQDIINEVGELKF